LNENADHEIECWLVQQTWWRWERTKHDLYQGHVDLHGIAIELSFFFEYASVIWLSKCC
jgi:hypothetical protein